MTGPRHTRIGVLDGWLGTLRAGRITVAAVALSMAVCRCAQAVSMQVAGAGAVLRCEPSADSRGVCNAARGELLNVESKSGEWMCVVPPERIQYWVLAELVRDGRTSLTVKVRTGPGTDFPAVTEIAKGAEVSIVSSTGEWVRIAGPASLRLWIESRFLRDPEAVPRPAGTNAVNSASSTRRTVQDAKPKPGAYSAVPGEPRKAVQPATAGRPRGASTQQGGGISGQGAEDDRLSGERVVLSGTVRPGGLIWSRTGKYRLAVPDRRGRYVTLCYLIGNEAKLSSLEGLRVRIRGVRQHRTGLRYPAVILESVTVFDKP